MADQTAWQTRHLAFGLRITRPAALPAFHGLALHGLFTRALGMKPLPRTLAVRCVERWSYPRKEGMLYRVGLTVAGSDNTSLDQVANLLATGMGRWTDASSSKNMPRRW